MATGHHHHHHQRWAGHVFPLPDHQIYARIYCHRKSTFICLQIYAIFDDAKKASHTRVYIRIQLINWQEKCFSFMFPGFVQPVRGKRMLARRVRERMRGVFRDGSTHVARRLWSACSNLEDIAHEWPTTTIRRPLAKPLTNLDQSSSPDLISPLHLTFPSNVPSIVKSWEVASEENSICPIPCFPSALSLFTRSSQYFAFYKSVMEFVYWKVKSCCQAVANLFSMFSSSLTSTTATSSSFELATSTLVESHQIKS